MTTQLNCVVKERLVQGRTGPYTQSRSKCLLEKDADTSREEVADLLHEEDADTLREEAR